MKRGLIILSTVVGFVGAASAETAPTKACVLEDDLCAKMASELVAFHDAASFDFVTTMPFEVIASIKNQTCTLPTPEEFVLSSTWGPTLESNRRFYFVRSEEKLACFISGFGEDSLRHGGKAGTIIGSLDSLRAE